MGRWSDECDTCEWHEGFDSPKVGATFDGHNRNGDKNWTTLPESVLKYGVKISGVEDRQGKVVEAEPGRAFTFECSAGGVHYATWGYRIELTDSGCRITEWTENLLPGKNQEMMATTLARLAAQLEG